MEFFLGFFIIIGIITVSVGGTKISYQQSIEKEQIIYVNDIAYQCKKVNKND